MFVNEFVEMKVKNNVLYVKSKASNITMDQAKEIAEEFRKVLRTGTIKKFIADNRELTGVYRPEVNDVLRELMEEVGNVVERIATICSNTIARMQMDRLSREAGTFEKMRAFTDEIEALAFVGLTSLE